MYVRYASGLVKEGVKLLHQVAIIFISVFWIKRNIVILWPNVRNGKFLKLMFCNKQNVSAELEANLVNLSLKPKLIIGVTALLYFLALTYFYISASTWRKHFQIKRTPKSLIDLKVHFIYAMCLTLTSLMMDQMKHFALELFYDWLGPETAFHIWWLFFILEFIGASGKTFYSLHLQHYKCKLRSTFSVQACIQCVNTCHSLWKAARVPWLQGQEIPRYSACRMTKLKLYLYFDEFFF